MDANFFERVDEMTGNLFTEDEIDGMFEYLDDLRESGVTNMFGAGAYLEGTFGLTRQVAGKVLTTWMKTFGERHPN